MKIGLCGNVTLDLLASELDSVFPGNDIIVGIAGNFAVELHDSPDELKNVDICIVFLDWELLTPLLYHYSIGGDVEKTRDEFKTGIENVFTVIREFRARSIAKIMVCSPVMDFCGTVGFIDRLVAGCCFDMRCYCQDMFNRMCRSVEDVYPLDMEEIAGRIGKSNAFDHKSYYCNRYPFSMLMTNAIVAYLKAVCLQFLRYPLKCIVLDLDNTLWGGIVGEIGTENILLSDSGEGKAYYDFQAEIVKLHKRGVILAVCSKNNTCDALDVFERHPHMLIKASMISSFRINWDDKPDNILQISAELKIGLDSIMFVDDNLSERAITKAVLPSVEIFELPDNPFLFADSLRRCTRFWPVQFTLDDTKKGAYFSQESKRLQARKLIENKCEFLRDSAIKVTISVGNSEAIPRIVQLFNKTNQFNLTTKRYCQNEIVKLTAQKENYLFYMEMCDRFGDYGVIASALIVDSTIDSFLLSCRAFGKHVEFAFLYQILHRLQNQGSMLVTGVYVATEKNGMAKDFYKIAGFKPVGEGKWTFDLMQEIPAGPDWIVVS